MKLMYSEAISGTEDIHSEPPAIITTYEDDNGKLQGLDPILYLDPTIEDAEPIAKKLVAIYNLYEDLKEEFQEIDSHGD